MLQFIICSVVLIITFSVVIIGICKILYRSYIDGDPPPSL
jgi:hypothetical protein